MNRATRRLLSSVACVLISSPIADATVRGTTLENLTNTSGCIVLGQVDTVLSLTGLRVAVFAVSQTLKGPVVDTLAFLAERTWTCDISYAAQGEELLLFLHDYEFNPQPNPTVIDTIGGYVVRTISVEFHEPMGFKEAVEALAQKAPFMQINWAGRGRMPVRFIQETAYVTLWANDIRLPDSVETVDGPEEQYSDTERSVPMHVIIALVRNWCKPTK